MHMSIFFLKILSWHLDHLDFTAVCVFGLIKFRDECLIFFFLFFFFPIRLFTDIIPVSLDPLYCLIISNTCLIWSRWIGTMATTLFADFFFMGGYFRGTPATTP